MGESLELISLGFFTALNHNYRYAFSFTCVTLGLKIQVRALHGSRQRPGQI